MHVMSPPLVAKEEAKEALVSFVVLLVPLSLELLRAVSSIN